MKVQRLGILSALVASFCCLTPLVLVVLGLGGLGLSATLGRFHWWFLGAALVLLFFAWQRHFRERKRCATESCEMASRATTRWTLLVSSLVVAAFAGLNVYTYASQRVAQHHHDSGSTGQGPLTEVVIPVEGMTCLTCELTIESHMKKLPGVDDVNARVATQSVWVRYDRATTTRHELVKAIADTGYKVNE